LALAPGWAFFSSGNCELNDRASGKLRLRLGWNRATNAVRTAGSKYGKIIGHRKHLFLFLSELLREPRWAAICEIEIVVSRQLLNGATNKNGHREEMLILVFLLERKIPEVAKNRRSVREPKFTTDKTVLGRRDRQLLYWPHECLAGFVGIAELPNWMLAEERLGEPLNGDRLSRAKHHPVFAQR
jgi:hypothetical protein